MIRRRTYGALRIAQRHPTLFQRVFRRIFPVVVVALAACGGGSEPDYYEAGGYCYAKVYFDGGRIIVTDDYVAYPGDCE